MNATPARPRRPSVATATSIVLAGALAVHLVAWVQYADDPFAGAPVSDALSYHAWGLRLAADGVAADPVFHQSPLYPLMLGAVYAATREPSPTSALAVQLFLGSLAVARFVPVGRVWFGSTATGVAAALVVLLHGPVVFHALKLVPVTLAVATQVPFLLALGLALGRRSPVPAAAAGIALGLAAVARSEMLLFVPLACAALATRRSSDGTGEPARPWVRPVALLIGVAVVIAPVTAHNLRAGDFVILASAGGENLYIGNQRGADGGHTPLDPRAGDILSQRALATEIAERAEGRSLRPSEVSAYWRGRALDEVGADVGAWLGLELRKLGRILAPGDPTDMYSFALERSRYLPVLYALPLPAWFVLFAAALGLLLSRGKWPRVWPLAGFAAIHVAVLLAFFVSTRLRLPLIVALAPFAGHALVTGWQLFRGGLRGPVIAAAAVLAALTVFGYARSSRTVPREVVRLASVLSTQNRPAEALEVLEPVVSGPEPYGVALDQAGWIHHKQGRAREASAFYERALQAGLPEGRLAQTHTRLAQVLETLGRTGEAAGHHDAAAGLPSANAGTFYERGLYRKRVGDLAGARADLERAASLDPGWTAPAAALEELQRATGD